MSDDARWPIAAAVACALLLALLTELTYGVASFRQFDLELFLRLSWHRHEPIGEAANAIARIVGDPLPAVALSALACAIAYLRRRRNDLLAAVVLLAGANLTTRVLKVVLGHPKVQIMLGGIGYHPTSFPSGHTTAAFSIAFAFAYVLPRRLLPVTLPLGIAVGVAVGISVVIAGWHFPSDAMGGFLVASGWALGVLGAMRIRERGSPARLGTGRPVPSL